MNIKYQKDKVLEMLELLENTKKIIVSSKNTIVNEISSMRNLKSNISVENHYLVNLYDELIKKIEEEIISIKNMMDIIERNSK